MTGLEILLFILGTAFVIISFFMVDNTDKNPKAALNRALDADDMEQLKADFRESANREADIILHQIEDRLADVSNDKIIAVGEYSDQVREKMDEVSEKIESNHKEVVFLYQMLNEKEEELKSTSMRMDNIRVECDKMLQNGEASVEELKERIKALSDEIYAAEQSAARLTAEHDKLMEELNRPESGRPGYAFSSLDNSASEADRLADIIDAMDKAMEAEEGASKLSGQGAELASYADKEEQKRSAGAGKVTDADLGRAAGTGADTGRTAGTGADRTSGADAAESSAGAGTAKTSSTRRASGSTGAGTGRTAGTGTGRTSGTDAVSGKTVGTSAGRGTSAGTGKAAGKTVGTGTGAGRATGMSAGSGRAEGTSAGTGRVSGVSTGTAGRPSIAVGVAQNAGRDTGTFNRNDEIIALHKAGKSVMEISKLLGMGQGEVKLIIDLYC